MFKMNLIPFLILIFCLSHPAIAEVKDSKWCSLKTNTVNIRTGPGKRYPIKWVYNRKNMPMKVLAEYDNWVKIEDFEGTTGWVHPSMVSDKYTFIVYEKYIYLQKGVEENSKYIAKLEEGVIGELIKCEKDLCKVETNGWEGYVPANSIWGCKN